MTDDMTVSGPDGEYVVRRDGDTLKIGQRIGDDVTWTDDVDVSLLPEPARAALDRGDTDDAALQLALRAVAGAEDQRGG